MPKNFVIYSRPDDAPGGIKRSGDKWYMKVIVRFQSPANIHYPIHERVGRNPRHYDVRLPKERKTK